MPEAKVILAHLDRIMAELAELRDAVAGDMGHAHIVEEAVGNTNSYDADDLTDSNLLDAPAAQERFGYPRDTIAKWCRTEGLGVKRGGRWLVSVPRLQRRINGK